MKTISNNPPQAWVFFIEKKTEEHFLAVFLLFFFFFVGYFFKKKTKTGRKFLISLFFQDLFKEQKNWKDFLSPRSPSRRRPTSPRRRPSSWGRRAGARRQCTSSAGPDLRQKKKKRDGSKTKSRKKWFDDGFLKDLCVFC